MKKLIVTSLMFILQLIGFTQNYIPIDTVDINFYYSYDFQQNSDSKYSLKNQEMVLQIGKHSSKFTASHLIYSDSVIMENSKEPPTTIGFQKLMGIIGGTNIHPYCKNYVYKNYPEKDKIMFTGYVNKKFIKVLEKITFQWQIIDRTDTILLGYPCQKAITSYAGRNYNAWFSTEIPISDGPFKFHGLPGLIVKISDEQNQHSFELVKIQNIKYIQPMYFLKKKYISVTAKEYVDAIDVGRAQLINRIQREDGIILESEEAKARALNSLKTRNNYIEKY